MLEISRVGFGFGALSSGDKKQPKYSNSVVHLVFVTAIGMRTAT